MIMTTRKKVLLVTVACLAVLALMAGVAVAVTGNDAEVGAKAGQCGDDCADNTGHKGSGSHRGEVKGEVAALLGLSPEDMEAELKSGKTLAELAEEKGVTTDQVLETITRKVGEALDAEVAAGNMTPEQAEERKSFAASRAADCIENGGCGQRGHGQGQRKNGQSADSCGCNGSGNGE